MGSLTSACIHPEWALQRLQHLAGSAVLSRLLEIIAMFLLFSFDLKVVKIKEHIIYRTPSEPLLDVINYSLFTLSLQFSM